LGRFVPEVYVARDELDGLTPTPVLFDALIWEDTGRGFSSQQGASASAFVLVKTLTMDDPGVAEQRTSDRWPHHLPGDVVILLTGQAGTIAMRRLGLIDEGWRGHGVRIRDARFSAPVLLGERFFTRAEVGRVRRWQTSLHVRFDFRMWKLSPSGDEIETFRSRQDAMFFPG
jgi:hypothetical protein